MKRLCAILALAGLLGACASTYADLTPQQRIYALQRDFDAALAEVEAYAALPECAPAIVLACHEPDVLFEAVVAANEADYQLDAAEAVVRTGGSAEDIEVFTLAARAALARIAALLVPAPEEGVAQ